MWAVVSISLDTGNLSVFATKLLKMLLTSNGVLGKRQLMVVNCPVLSCLLTA